MSAAIESLNPIELANTEPIPNERTQFGVIGWVAIGIVALAVVTAVFAPLLAPHSPTGGSLIEQYQSPSAAHPLGTDENGNDILSRLIHGARPSLLGPLAVVSLSLLVGLPLALLSAWRGGTVDTIIGRVLDLIFAFPAVLVASIIVLLYGAGLTSAVVAVTIAYIPWAARITRAAALRERNKPYIIACELQGFSATTIAVRHLLPNLSRLVIAQATVAIGYALVDLAALSFIGLGIRPPDPDWGQMVAATTGIVQGHYTTPLVAGACVVLVVSSFAIIGNRISDSVRET